MKRKKHEHTPEYTDWAGGSLEKGKTICRVETCRCGSVRMMKFKVIEDSGWDESESDLKRKEPPHR